jgi:hypothetical protein
MKRTETDRNGLKRNETDRNGMKRMAQKRKETESCLSACRCQRLSGDIIDIMYNIDVVVISESWQAGIQDF